MILIKKAIFSCKSILAVFVILLIIVCVVPGAGFSLLGHRFGDSMEQVSGSEKAAPLQRTDSTLLYENTDLFDGKVEIVYHFESDKLQRLAALSLDSVAGDEVYDYLINKLSSFGRPDLTSLCNPKISKSGKTIWLTKKSLWKKEGYGIALFFEKYNRFLVYFDRNPGYAQNFYETYDSINDMLKP